MPARKKFLIKFYIALAIFLFLPKIIQAAISINIDSLPSEVQIGEEFIINISIGGLNSETYYYIKSRVGKTSIDMNKGETFNELTSKWLGDTDSWADFPKVLSNIEGNLSVSLKSRAKSTAELGENLLTIRLRKVGSNDNAGESNPVKITLLESPTQSPILTLTPTPTLTSIPTSTIAPSIITSSTPTPTPTPNDYSNIFISEYFPNPESGNEWIELYNGNNFEVNLSGWYLDDIADRGSEPKLITGTISARGYKQFYLTSAYLNNGGDDVRLLNGSQNEKDKTSFESSTQGKSWSKDNNGDWCQVDPTPNSSNPDCPEENISTATATATSAPTSSPSSTPTPTKKLTPTPTEKIATPSGEILGETQEATAAFYPLEATAAVETKEAEKEATPSSKKKTLGKIFIGAGFLALFGAAFWLWYTKIKGFDN